MKWYNFAEVFMKYFCYTNIKLTKARKELVEIMHPRIKSIINGLDKVFELEDGDVVVFDSVLELDPSGNNEVEVIKKNYKHLIGLGLILNFDRSPSLDSEIMFIQEETFGFDNLLDLKINDYLNIKNSATSIKQYSQKKVMYESCKSYGRPKGTKRETPKAIATKQMILTESSEFEGNCSDTELINRSGISRRMYYLYKNELKKQQENKGME